MKTVKFIVATALKFLISLVRTEYQLKVMLEQKFMEMAKKRRIRLKIDWQPSDSPQEWVMTMTITKKEIVRKYITEVLNEVSYDKKQLSRYLNSYVAIFEKQIEDL